MSKHTINLSSDEEILDGSSIVVSIYAIEILVYHFVFMVGMAFATILDFYLIHRLRTHSLKLNPIISMLSKLSTNEHKSAERSES